MEGKIRLAVFGQKRLSREGGIEIVVKELCTRMAQNGCEVTCYNRAGHHVSGAEYDKTIEYDGIRQKVVPTIEKKGLAAVSSSFFAALYSAFGRYDVVHIHAEGPAFFCWIPKLFGKRVINTVHGLDWDREKWRGSVASKFIRGGEKNAVKYADEIIVLSKGVQKYFMDTYGRETHFIPNGVNRPEVREAKLITDHFGLEKDSYILFLGRLVPEKGIRYLVEAFKNVKTDKKLVIAGGSTFNNYKESQSYKDAVLSTASALKLSKASVTSYLPYEKGVYFPKEAPVEKISVGAERQRRYRAVRKLRTEPTEKHLWEVVLLYSGVRFKTYSGLPFTYEIRKGRNGQYTKELWIDRRENSKSLAWSSVLLALNNIKEVGAVVDRPKALGDIRGVTYIYGMFYRFGLIDMPDKVNGKMKRAGRQM